MIRSAFRLVIAGAALTALALGVAGCFNPFSPLIAAGLGIAQKKPEPNSPEGVIELFQWCYQNRAYPEYREIFTDDYVFTFSSLDSAGNAYRGTPWRREDELASAEHLFVTGTASEGAATSITLEFGNTLFDLADNRPGKNPTWHRQVNVQVVLDVRLPSSTLNVKGQAQFYVVRGDSAALPTDVTGLTHDPGRWFIEGWVDNTVASGVAQAGSRPAGGASLKPAGGPSPATPLPITDLTFGALKARYR